MPFFADHCSPGPEVPLYSLGWIQQLVEVWKEAQSLFGSLTAAGGVRFLELTKGPERPLPPAPSIRHPYDLSFGLRH